MNRLSPRERMLAICVVLLLVCGGGFLGFRWYSEKMDASSSLIFSLEQQLSDMDAADARLASLNRLRMEYRDKSLSAEPEIARSEYRDWLWALANDHVGLSAVNVHLGEGGVVRNRKRDVVYQTVRCTVTGMGTFEQCTHLLDEYFRGDFVHRIVALDLNPVAAGVQDDGKREILRLSLTSLALCVPDAEDRAGDAPSRSPLRDRQTVSQDYLAMLTRDIFNPPSSSPTFGSPSSNRFYVGDPIEVSLNVRDDDPFNRFKFELLLDRLPEELRERVELARDDGDEASFRLPPLDIDEYVVGIRATDNGFPAETIEQYITFNVVERRVRSTGNEQPVELDIAELSKVTAIVQDRQGRPIVWIDVKPEGVMYELTIGDEFEIGSMKGVVDDISGRNVILLVGGQRLRYTPPRMLSEPEVLPSITSIMDEHD